MSIGYMLAPLHESRMLVGENSIATSESDTYYRCCRPVFSSNYCQNSNFGDDGIAQIPFCGSSTARIQQNSQDQFQQHQQQQQSQPQPEMAASTNYFQVPPKYDF